MWRHSMTITTNTKLIDIFNLPLFKPMAGQFISSNTDWFTGGKEQMSLEALNKLQPTWAAEDMIYGLERLWAIADQNKEYVIPLNEGANGTLISMPADKPKTDLPCLLLAGGAYGAVCSMVEAIPVAARMNALGINCFCLNYRTATPESMVHGLMPKPLDDIAEAVKHMNTHCHTADYYMAGFSAGGHAAALWGTKHLGARHYGLGQPKALFLVYPLNSLLSLPAGPIRDYMLQGLFGTGFNSDLTQRYSVCHHIDKDYPPVWIEKALDDTSIPYKDTELLCSALKEQEVYHHCEMIPEGGHGFGLDSKTPASGWVDRAIEWVEGI